MNFFAKTFKWVKARFDNVWNDKYPPKWHLVDLFCGVIAAILFVTAPSSSKQYNTSTLVGLFFAITIIGYLVVLAFTYGIVRARNAWTKKRK